MIEEMEKKLGWFRGVISHADNGLVLALKEVDGKYPGKRFRLSLEKYRKPIPSQETLLAWGNTLADEIKESGAIPSPRSKPFRNEFIHFEETIEGEIIGWCSHLDYLKARVEARRLFKKKVAA